MNVVRSRMYDLSFRRSIATEESKEILRSAQNDSSLFFGLWTLDFRLCTSCFKLPASRLVHRSFSGGGLPTFRHKILSLP